LKQKGGGKDVAPRGGGRKHCGKIKKIPFFERKKKGRWGKWSRSAGGQKGVARASQEKRKKSVLGEKEKLCGG